MISISPSILLDENINKSFSDIVNCFKKGKFITIIEAWHSADFLHFVSLIKLGLQNYQLIECAASAVIKYNSGRENISLIYISEINCRPGIDVDPDILESRYGIKVPANA